MIILGCELYGEILHRIKSFQGLTLECLHYLHNIYPQFSPRTLWSILSWEHRERFDGDLRDMQQDSRELLLEYEQRVIDNPTCDFALIVMAMKRRYSPFVLSRTLLAEKLNVVERKVAIMLQNPMNIEDELLRKNIIKCIELDIMEGPVADDYRNKIGIFFEDMLYHMLKQAGVQFNTEKDLRRMGYRKTPDAHLLSRCYYRGERIKWIESKASFGTPFNHSQVMQRQLLAYRNDFGPGIVIYWMGFVDEILNEGRKSIHIRYDFPGPQEFNVKNVIRGKSKKDTS
ncbi:CDAN1-interacting nuclease 1-like [Lutzomyia longipalpis]|uniref:CDAN1-interacting nuclease 1-like n=1 Tax=Lutzomyia longipalpis TaxID=7200 RepID=UPI0024838A0D|nr:CDAN1-interacting nuclease 1-like [Lutzomyia longipalpis]